MNQLITGRVAHLVKVLESFLGVLDRHMALTLGYIRLEHARGNFALGNSTEQNFYLFF